MPRTWKNIVFKDKVDQTEEFKSLTWDIDHRGVRRMEVEGECV